MRTLAIAVVLASSVAVADAPRYELVDNVLVVPHPITFEAGKASLQPASNDAIAYVVGYLNAKPYISLLRIEVHSDATGNEAANQKLTEQRALAVGRALVGKGADCKRLIAVGFGSTKPVADNKTPEGRAQNRRTSFVNAALRGRPIGGMPVDGNGKLAGDVCTP